MPFFTTGFISFIHKNETNGLLYKPSVIIHLVRECVVPATNFPKSLKIKKYALVRDE